MEESRANNRKTVVTTWRIMRILWLVSLWALTAGPVHGQNQQSEAYKQAERRYQNLGSVAEAIQKVKQGNFYGPHVEEIAEAGAVEAIPALKEQFAHSVDPSHKDDLDPGNKEEIASALVRLGEKDDIYWDFLVKQATEAVDSDAPFPREFDSQGKMLDDHFSPAFLQWVKQHGLSPGDAGEMVVYRLPGKLFMLAETGDPRGIPLLRRGMSSANYMIQIMAAKGLAKLQDRDSIPVIIAACQSSSWASPVIAEVLVYFDDPEAQAAAEKYLPKGMFKTLRDKRHAPLHDPFAQ
jgi:nucleoid-associated protein YgaU